MNHLPKHYVYFIFPYLFIILATQLDITATDLTWQLDFLFEACIAVSVQIKVEPMNEAP